MFTTFKALKAFWVKIQYDYLITSKIVFKEPCYVFACGCLGAGTGTGTVTLKNGQSNNGDSKLSLGVTNQQATDDKIFERPIYFSKGLYIYIGSNVTSAYVQFLPEAVAVDD